MATVEPVTVLLIGDNRTDYVTIRHLLVDETRGEYQVTWSRTLSDGLNLLKTNTYQVLLFDLTTSLGQSQRAFSEFWNELVTQPVIVICPPENEGAAIDAVKRGAQDYLLHSHIDRERLHRAINLALVRSALSNEQKKKAGLEKTMGLSRLKEDFMGLLANEVWLPLLGGRLVLEHLLEGSLGDLNEQQKVALSQLKKGNEESLAVTQELLDVYTYDQTRQQLAKSDIDMKEMIENCIKETAQMAKFRGINVVADYPQGAPMIKGDPSGIRRVFIILLDNAIKFSPNRQTVDVNVAQLPDAVQVSINDRGRDIAPEDQKRLFMRFWEGESGRKFSNKSGMHFYLCQRIIDSHGGKMEVTSKPQTGTTFIVTLPK
ncbi:MAG: HAMP domain-containing histidine kinase [Candidatus Melainabacteria bacterium]|nr:HAMP domain-containing histidine kinase [Candidatus Melainabacteria bacterium]